MGYDFNADDILEVAEQLEKNGARFYRNAAENTEDPSIRELLAYLASMEDQHERTFAGLRAELTEQDKRPGAFDPDDETARYLKALADRRVFHEKSIDLNSLEEVLKEAIVTEKDSIAFYVGMRELVPGSLGKVRRAGTIAKHDTVCFRCPNANGGSKHVLDLSHRTTPRPLERYRRADRQGAGEVLLEPGVVRRNRCRAVRRAMP